jgi:hypothetical protein
MGFSISNINISSSSNFAGIFVYGYKSIVSNLIIQNVQINSSLQYVGALFAQCVNCNISNINLTTSNSSITNTIQGSYDVGGLIGLSGIVGNSGTSSIISNCFISNTFINGTSTSAYNIGGIVGNCQYCSITNCHNLGILSSPNSVIVSSMANTVGGIVGGCFQCSIIKSGTTQGIISSAGYSGSISGYNYSKSIFTIIFKIKCSNSMLWFILWRNYWISYFEYSRKLFN